MEYLFTGTVSMVYQALWTRNGEKLDEHGFNEDEKKACSLYGQPAKDYSSVDVTKFVQAAMTAYLKVFGTKNVDFDRNISCFSNLAKLVGESVTKDLLALSSDSPKQWVMYLMC
jgi:hypothetical protein